MKATRDLETKDRNPIAEILLLFGHIFFKETEQNIKRELIMTIPNPLGKQESA